MHYHSTNPQHYHGVHRHASTTGVSVLPSLAGRQAGWPSTPDFAEWARGQNPDFAEWSGGTQNTEITGVGEELIDVRNFPFSSTVHQKPVISVTQKNGVFRKGAHPGEAHD